MSECPLCGFSPRECKNKPLVKCGDDDCPLSLNWMSVDEWGKSRRSQCPFEPACKCLMDEPCEGCETFAEHHKCQPDKELVEALEGMVKSYDNVWINHTWYTGDYQMLPSEVAKSVVAAEQALAKYKEKK